MQVALVLAANSFVGKHLSTTLQRRGVTVVGTARKPNSSLLECDMLNRTQVQKLIAGVQPDHIFACAAATGGSTSLTEQYALHVTGTLHLLETLAALHPRTKVTIFGSAAEYGNVAVEHLPTAESAPTHPSSFFGASKLAQTHLAQQAARQWGLPIVVVRPFNILGPGLGKHYLASQLIARLRAPSATSDELVVANGSCTRDFVDVRDVVDALAGLAASECHRPGTLGIFNIATGTETAVSDVAAFLSRLAGKGRVLASGAMDSRSGIDRSCGNAERLRVAIKWAPRFDWQRSLTDMWHAN